MLERLIVTPVAAELIRNLDVRHGPLIFHLSGGCCEGSAPLCLPRKDFAPSPDDILLGAVEGCPFYVSAAHYPYWSNCRLTLDVVIGGVDSFSVEAAELRHPLTDHGCGERQLFHS